MRRLPRGRSPHRAGVSPLSPAHVRRDVTHLPACLWWATHRTRNAVLTPLRLSHSERPPQRNPFADPRSAKNEMISQHRWALLRWPARIVFTLSAGFVASGLLLLWQALADHRVDSQPAAVARASYSSVYSMHHAMAPTTPADNSARIIREDQPSNSGGTTVNSVAPPSIPPPQGRRRGWNAGEVSPAKQPYRPFTDPGF